MMGFAGFTTNKTLATKVKKFFALAPVATTKDMRGLFYYISEFYKEVEVVVLRREGREGEEGEVNSFREKEKRVEVEGGEVAYLCALLRNFSLIPSPLPPPPPTYTHTHTHSFFLTYLDMASSS